MGIYEELGVRRLINARCILGRYGDSLTHKAVVDAMCEASESNVSMWELHEAVGRRIAELTQNEAGMVCAGAAHGGQIAIAGCMTGVDEDKRRRLPDTTGMRNEVIMRGRWPEDMVILQTGAKVVEIEGKTEQELADTLKAAITERTAAIFMWGRHRTASIPIPLAVEIGHAHNVPVIIDAAYDIPPKDNLWYYTKTLGVGAVIFSGGKALRGPASTGFVVGRRDIVESCQFHVRPHSGIGLASKIGKEELVGLYVAVKLLVEQDEAALHERYRQQIAYIIAQLAEIPHLRSQPIEHGVWGDDFGVNLFVDGKVDLADGRLYEACTEGSPYIEVGDRGKGVYVCVSTLKPGEERIVAERVREAFRKVLKL